MKVRMKKVEKETDRTRREKKLKKKRIEHEEKKVEKETNRTRREEALTVFHPSDTANRNWCLDQ